MTLVTRCPGCHTIFRLTGGQLHSHNGDVRCGQCKQVFNGFAALIAVTGACIQPVVMLLPSDSDQSDSDNVAARPIAETSPPVDHFDIQPSAPRISRRWLVPNAVLLVLLLSQLMHAYRTEIFIAFPAFRPVLDKYCTLMQCEVDLPRHLHLLSLESSDLRVSSSADPDVVELSAIIRNHAPFPQALPALLLTLTDTDEKPLANRIFTAKDYLDSAADQSVFVGGSEIQVQCFLNTNQLNAMGYKLELLYP